MTPIQVHGTFFVLPSVSATIEVIYPEGATLTCTKNGTVYTAPDSSGTHTFTVTEVGIWTITATLGERTENYTVTIYEDGQRESIVISLTTLGDLLIGAIVNIPVNGKDCNWIVVHHGRPSSIYDVSFNDGTILLMQDLYENRQRNDSFTNGYSISTIHSYLNITFLNLIEERIRSKIIDVKIPYRAGNGTATTISSGADGLPTKVFLPSAREVGVPLGTETTQTSMDEGFPYEHFNGAGNARRISYLNGVVSLWWLRTPSKHSQKAYYIGKEGGPTLELCSVSLGIRPAIVLPSSTVV